MAIIRTKRARKQPKFQLLQMDLFIEQANLVSEPAVCGYWQIVETGLSKSAVCKVVSEFDALERQAVLMAWPEEIPFTWDIKSSIERHPAQVVGNDQSAFLFRPSTRGKPIQEALEHQMEIAREKQRAWEERLRELDSTNPSMPLSSREAACFLAGNDPAMISVCSRLHSDGVNSR